MTWKLVITVLTFVAVGVGLFSVGPAVAPWYFDDFRLDRSLDQMNGIDVIAAAHHRRTIATPSLPPAPPPAPAAETTGFASK
jgi:hypothetical protein